MVIILLAANNPETVKKLKVIFDGFKDAAKTYAKVLVSL